jgi:regulator of protease activity HflC (stomatin/prohibitin superfamily)
MTNIDMPPQSFPTGVGSKIARAVLLVLSGILLIPLLPFSIKVVNEYERGVIFRLGRLIGAKGPGLFILLPFADRMVKVDLRTITLDVPAQEAITRDNVTVKVNAVIYFRIVEPTSAVVRIADFVRATSQIAQTTLRSVLGQSNLDELLSEREHINQRLQIIIDEQTEPWGVKVSTVEVKDVELPSTMQRAMARQAEAERERRAKVIAADGEFQASQRLREAADIMAQQPITVQLRYLQTLAEIATENNSTIVFPIPIDLMQTFLQPQQEEPAEPAATAP